MSCHKELPRYCGYKDCCCCTWSIWAADDSVVPRVVMELKKQDMQEIWNNKIKSAGHSAAIEREVDLTFQVKGPLLELCWVMLALGAKAHCQKNKNCQHSLTPGSRSRSTPGEWQIYNPRQKSYAAIYSPSIITSRPIPFLVVIAGCCVCIFTFTPRNTWFQLFPNFPFCEPFGLTVTGKSNQWLSCQTLMSDLTITGISFVSQQGL